MTRITQHRGSLLGLIARRLAVLALPAVLLVGCSDDDNPPPAPTATSVPATATATAVPPTATRTSTTVPTATHTATVVNTATPTLTPVPPTATVTPPNSSAGAACQKLTDCGQCFIDSNGQCIPVDGCVTHLSDDAAICVNGISGCNATTLGDCLFLGCDGNDATGSCQ